MLKRKIQIFAYLGILPHHFEQIFWEARGVGIVEPYPLDAIDLRHGIDKIGELILFVEVSAIGRQVLRNHLQLLDPTRRQVAGLRQYILHRAACVRPGDKRYGAVAAHSVAALGYFDVGIVRWRGERAFAHQIAPESGPKLLHEARPIKLAIKLVHFRYLLRQLAAISLTETSHDVKFFELATVLCLSELENGVDGLLLGIANEAASVDYSHLTLGVVGIMLNGYVIGAQLGHKSFAVYQILGAAERYDIYKFHCDSILLEQRLDKRLPVEELNVINSLTHANVFDGDAELIRDPDHNTTFGCAV